MTLAPLYYIERTTGQKQEEKVYGSKALALLYGEHPFAPLLRKIFLPICRLSLFSQLYSMFQRTGFSRRKIKHFIKDFNVDSSEFAHPPESYTSFDRFFSRTLKPEARPIASNPNAAIIPADGRFLCFQKIDQDKIFFLKGRHFTLTELLGNEQLAAKYRNGSCVIGRLAPMDYHRFHFPCTGIPGNVRLIAGWLYSVNPAALKHNWKILTQNKRMITFLDSPTFGSVAMLEIGATNVGSIRQTYIDGRTYEKGHEKGYFSFGGSALVLLFEEGKIQLDRDLVANTAKGIETRCLMGQQLGVAAS